MTRSGGEDQIEYFRLSASHLGEMDLTEYQLSHFDPVAHSYMPYRLDLPCEAVLPGLDFAGPVALFHSSGVTLLAAYEHGVDHPNSFLRFRVEGQGTERCLVASAARANYYDGREIGQERGWESVWFEVALFPAGIEAFLPALPDASFWMKSASILNRGSLIFFTTPGTTRRGRTIFITVLISGGYECRANAVRDRSGAPFGRGSFRDRHRLVYQDGRLAAKHRNASPKD